MSTLRTGALTTVARLADYMGIDVPASNSTLENSMISTINAVTSYIERYTGITFHKTDYIEIYDTERGQTLNLKHYPVVDSSPFILERRDSQLNEDSWEEIDSLYYRVDEDSGIITALDGIYFFRTRQGYRVTYTAGYDYDNITTFLGDTEGGEVEVAMWLIAQDVQNNKGQDFSIKAEKIGDYSITYGDLTKVMFGNPQAKEILDMIKDQGLDELGVLTPLQSI